MAELGLTPPQLFALRVLDPERPVPMRELAAQLHCDSSNVTGLRAELLAVPPALARLSAADQLALRDVMRAGRRSDAE